ncbi:hypothetical protein RUM43_002209 [Polyplax serrata]|uniref:Uncharacterized protein n=1 Tax=Polyplax serrata TaxID=468196 RepID=A0AAN8PDI4_POLSC
MIVSCYRFLAQSDLESKYSKNICAGLSTYIRSNTFHPSFSEVECRLAGNILFTGKFIQISSGKGRFFWSEEMVWLIKGHDSSKSIEAGKAEQLGHDKEKIS